MIHPTIQPDFDDRELRIKWKSQRSSTPIPEYGEKIMQILLALGMLTLAYVIGSIPFGLVIVKLTTGQDIRDIESGRTGGTNAMRAAGFWAGLFTALFDMLKATVMVWVAKVIFPLETSLGNAWLHILSPLAVILGHNYSIFLIRRNESGRLRLRGGAGGAPCVGGSVGMWAPSFMIIVPLAAAILFGIGYASVTTMSVALLSTITFTILAIMGLAPWQYALYGIFAEILLVVALLPNIRRLIAGQERLVGWRARRKQKPQ
jgi:acyl phosphate:glycerol-3-phosphate acyltransferase